MDFDRFPRVLHMVDKDSGQGFWVMEKSDRLQ